MFEQIFGKPSSALKVAIDENRSRPWHKASHLEDNEFGIRWALFPVMNRVK